jgi:hypothetical protein
VVLEIPVEQIEEILSQPGREVWDSRSSPLDPPTIQASYRPEYLRYSESDDEAKRSSS